MTKHLNEIYINLTKKITCHVDGQITEIDKLKLVTASLNDLKETTFLKQGFFKAMKSARDLASQNTGDSDTKDEKLTGDIILMLLNMSDIDMVEYANNFKTLLLSVCYINNTKIKDFSLDQVSDADFEMMMEKYLEFFLLASWIQKLEKLT